MLRLDIALYFSCTKLKYYLISCEVFVISKVNVIKYMYSSPMLHNRVGKWMLALTEFSLHFVLTKVVKGLVLVDFLVNDSGLEIEEVNLIETKPWRLYFDGSKHQKGWD